MSDPVGNTPRNEGQDRNAVLEFMEEMHAKLRKNRHKAHWSTVSQAYLFARVDEEMRELAHALLSGSPDEIINECADVANFAMMIADNARGDKK